MRSIPSLLFACFWLCALTSAAALDSLRPAPKWCRSLRLRLEWRMLTNKQKQEYIQAIRCLQRLPARKPTSPNVKSRFDQIQATHIDVTDLVHGVGHFLPWHRKLTLIHENMLRTECKYNGPIPYWDWSKDADTLTNMRGSPIFDPVHGFGGDGVPGTYTLPANYTLVPSRVPINPAAWTGCVMDGPFASYQLNLGPGRMVTKHCLVRTINNTYTQYITSKAVRNATIQPNFELFRIELEGRPNTPTPRMHDAAHVLVGGEMSNPYSSVGDPLFFLHHANLDRIWWNWQQINPAKRVYEITGRSTVTPPYRNVTLDYMLEFGALSPSVPIREVMNIHAEPACYTYV